MFDAKYIQRGDIIDYVPVADTAAGSVVFLGAVCGITKIDIKAGELGAIAITGVYEFAKASGSAIDAGAALYWDAANAKVTATPNACPLGIAVAAAASAATAVRVLINVGAGEAVEESSSSSSSSH